MNKSEYTMIVENLLSLISLSVENEKAWFGCGAVIFELITINVFGLTSRCHAVPFAALVMKKVPSPHGLICQNIELSASV
jgi:hypothetical protein